MADRRHPQSKRASQNQSVSVPAENPHQSEESLLTQIQQQGKSLLTDAIIIALVTGIAYVWTLNYELGFCGYFNIPYYLISLNPTAILATSAPMFIVLWILALFLLGLFMLYSYLIKQPIPIFIIFVLVFVVNLANSLYHLQISSEDRVLYIVLAAITASLLIIFPIWRLFMMRNEKGSYWYKLNYYKNVTEEQSKRRKPRISFSYGLRVFVITFLISISVPLIAKTFYKGGIDNAKKQEDFFVITRSQFPEVVVVRSYGEYFFAVPIIRATQEFEKKLLILKMSDLATDKTFLSMEKVGSLHPLMDIKP